VNAYEVKAGIGVIVIVTLCDPCPSTLSVRYYKKCAIQIHLPLPWIQKITEEEYPAVSKVYCTGAHPSLLAFEPTRVLNTLKLAYDPCRLDS